MATFFPRQTMEFRLEEPRAVRRFTFSLVGMAVVTGVALRLIRLATLTHGSNSWLYFGLTLGFGVLVLLGMATAHLANFPLHRWARRSAGFALVEVATELAVSVILIAAGLERIGTAPAHFHDIGTLLWMTLLIRAGLVLVWSLFLAGIVKLVRNRFVTVDEIPGVGE